jgi:hypothetical protein
MTHSLIFPLLLSIIISWMNVWLWAYSLGPYSPTNPTGILTMTFWFIFIWTWFEVANLDRDVVMNGLKREVTMALAGCFPHQWDDFVLTVKLANKDLHRLRERERPTKKNTPSVSKDKKDTKLDQSKYKLSDSNQKEHINGNLCFKCHKKGHSSKECKGTHTVYSEFKKSQAQVSNIKTKETKSKGKAKIEEIMAKEEDGSQEEHEDFPKGD